MDYNNLTKDDKNAIFDDLNTMVYRFNTAEKRTHKASFTHRWNKDTSVAYKLMVRTHQKLFKAIRIPNEQLTELEIKLGRVYNGKKVMAMMDETHSRTEEMEELYEKMKNGTDHVTEEYHDEKVRELKKEKKEELEEKDRQIASLKYIITNKDLSLKASEDRCAAMRRDFLDPQKNL